MFVRPKLAIKARKQQFKDKESHDFRRTLDEFCDPVCIWMGKIIKNPIESIANDRSLNFVPKRPNALVPPTLSKQKFLQLKVRIKALIKCIVHSDMPEETITKFFVSLTDDDNYFYAGFLYEDEESNFELNEHGGTRGMVRQIENKEDRSPETACNKGELIIGESWHRRKVDASRARKLILNYLLVRILIHHCLLSPWHYHICKKPRADAKETLDNFRVIASIVYKIVLKVNPSLVPLMPEVLQWEAILDGNDEIEGIDESSERNIGNNEEKTDGEEKENTNDQEDNNTNDGNNDNEDVGGNEEGQEVKYEPGSFMAFMFAKPVYSKDSTEDNSQKTNDDFMRETLLNPRKPYTPLQSTVDYLFRDTEFNSIQSQLEDTITESAKLLSNYIDKIVTHILDSRDHEPIPGFHDEGELAGEHPDEYGAGKSKNNLKLLYIDIVGILFHVECYIRNIWSSSIIICFITSIAHNHHTNIYHLLNI